jgi:branched-chain amino acid transport system ATP-binding protein
MAHLNIQNLDAFYGRIQVLHGVNLSIEEGTIFSLLGSNGAGKTTTLRAISHTIKTRGKIEFEGFNIQNYEPSKIVRLGVAHVCEGRGTFVDFTVDENLEIGAITRKDKKEIKKDKLKMYEYFPKLAQFRDKSAGFLSGGEQQMLAIARGLMLKPRLILLDEPSTGLAPLIVQDIFNFLRRINDEVGMTILLVEQNVRLALDLADQACLLDNGKVIMMGDVSEFRRNEVIRKTYLGY